MKEILFVCTGNYYRSRFAEIIFNHLAREQAAPVRAFSRGLRLNPVKNTGVISPHTLTYLEQLNISLADAGTAVKLDPSDLTRAAHIIVLDETEHRTMMQSSFPDWEHRVTYWSFEDDYIVSPEQVLPALQRRVEELFEELRMTQG